MVPLEAAHRNEGRNSVRIGMCFDKFCGRKLTVHIQYINAIYTRNNHFRAFQLGSLAVRDSYQFDLWQAFGEVPSGQHSFWTAGSLKLTTY